MTELNFGVAVLATHTRVDGHGFVLVDPTSEGEPVTEAIWASGSERGRLQVTRACPPEYVRVALDMWETVGRGEPVEGTHRLVSLRVAPGRMTIAPIEGGEEQGR